MGPKKSDNTNKGTKTSLGNIATSNIAGGGTAGEQGHSANCSSREIPSICFRKSIMYW